MSETIRCVRNGRLAYFRETADQDFWDAHWDKHFTDKLYEKHATGRLGIFEDVFSRWLPDDGKIVEAGCGYAHFVLALQARGYDVEGVDFAEKTVKQINELLPDISVRVADVLAFDVPENHYAGYISLGVIEHIESGPEPFLEEAYRVLRPGGIGLISVPWFNNFRRLKAGFGAFRQSPEDRSFYQFAFSEKEYRNILQAHNFEILEITGYDPQKGLRDEIPFIRKFWARQDRAGYNFRRTINYILRRSPKLSRSTSHMMMAAVRKPL